MSALVKGSEIVATTDFATAASTALTETTTDTRTTDTRTADLVTWLILNILMQDVRSIEMRPIVYMWGYGQPVANILLRPKEWEVFQRPRAIALADDLLFTAQTHCDDVGQATRYHVLLLDAVGTSIASFVLDMTPNTVKP